MCLPSDALLQHLPSFLDFSYLGLGVSLHGCSSTAQPLLLTSDGGSSSPRTGVAPLGHTSTPIAAVALLRAVVLWDYCGQESLRRNGVAIVVIKRVRNAVLGCNLKNDRMVSVHFQGKPFNIMVIQVYVPTSNAKKLKLNGSMKTYKTFWN